MQKKLLIPILVVLVLVIVLVVRGCGNKDTSQDNKQDGTQSTQTDTFDNTNTTGFPPAAMHSAISAAAFPSLQDCS